MRKKEQPKIKTCPFFDENCHKSKCEIYNEILDRCEIGLLNYNIYQLITVMKKQLEI